MSLTVPPIVIPLALLALVVVLWKYWLPAQIRAVQIRTRWSRKQAGCELVGIPLLSFALIGVVLHVTGNDAILSPIIQALVWCGRGLLWDLLHPFAYGFGIAFS